MSTPHTSQELITYSDEDAAALFPEFRTVEEGRQIVPIRLPLCLPQGSTGVTAAFTRAYSPELQASGIEMDDWLRFLDGLNIAMSASPPLRVVELAGTAIGFVPNHWAMIASVSMQVVAQTGIRIIAKTLTDRYLRRANAEYFAPRSLRARICKTEAMLQLVRGDPLPDVEASSNSTSVKGKVTKFAKDTGRVAETVALHLPVIRVIYNRVAPSAPAIKSGMPGGMAARRLTLIEGYALPLSFDVPSPLPEEGIMNKASDLSLRLQKYRASQAEAKAERKRQLLAIQEGRATSLTTPPPSNPSQNAFMKALDQRRARKDERDERRAVLRAATGRVNRTLQSRVEIADRKEWKDTGRLLWIVLLNAEQDAKIQGRDVADADVDVEEITEQEWQAQIGRENTEDILPHEDEDQRHEAR